MLIYNGYIDVKSNFSKNKVYLYYNGQILKGVYESNFIIKSPITNENIRLIICGFENGTLQEYYNNVFINNTNTGEQE